MPVVERMIIVPPEFRVKVESPLVPVLSVWVPAEPQSKVPPLFTVMAPAVEELPIKIALPMFSVEPDVTVNVPYLIQNEPVDPLV